MQDDVVLVSHSAFASDEGVCRIIVNGCVVGG